jgi:hypothetical protein
MRFDFDISYTPEKRIVFMSQRAYAKTILERADMQDCKPAPTPARPGQLYTKTDCPPSDAERAVPAAQGMTKELYHTLAASNNHLVQITRPDLQFIQGKTSKYTANPGAAHWNALKRMLRFVKGTLHSASSFRGMPPIRRRKTARSASRRTATPESLMR